MAEKYVPTRVPRSALWICENNHHHNLLNGLDCPECKCELKYPPGAVIPPPGVIPQLDPRKVRPATPTPKVVDRESGRSDQDKPKCDSPVATKDNSSDGKSPAQPRDPKMKKTVVKSEKTVEFDSEWRGVDRVMDDSGAFGLKRCSANHYFHFSYGSCTFCGRPAVDDDEADPVPVGKQTVVPSPLPDFNQLSVAVSSTPRDSDNLDDDNLTKCKESHLDHESWKACHYCVNAPVPVFDPEPEPEPHFNPFQKARDAQEQFVSRIRATGWSPGPSKNQPRVFQKSHKEKQQGGPRNSRVEFNHSSSYKPFNGANPTQGGSGSGNLFRGKYPTQGGSLYFYNSRGCQPAPSGFGSGPTLRGQSPKQGDSGIATPSTGRQPTRGGSNSADQKKSAEVEESVKSESGQNLDTQPAGSVGGPEPQRPVPKPRRKAEK